MRLTLCKLLSMRKSDGTSATDFTLTDNFNPHPPCGERQETKAPEYFVIDISIHTLHAEGDFIIH